MLEAITPMSDNTKETIQCFCKWEKDDTDYKGHILTKYNGIKHVIFVRKCKKCGKLRANIKESEEKDPETKKKLEQTLL